MTPFDRSYITSFYSSYGVICRTVFDIISKHTLSLKYGSRTMMATISLWESVMTAEELVDDADERLFSKVRHCVYHVLEELLPPKSDSQHNLRKRRHNITLPEKKGHLAAKNFIIRCCTKTPTDFITGILITFFSFSMFVMFSMFICYSAAFCQLCFYRAMHFSAKRGIAIACRLSVCLSVCL